MTVRDELLASILKLSCDDQFAIATRVASNVGYVLTGEPTFDKLDDVAPTVDHRAGPAMPSREDIAKCIDPSGWAEPKHPTVNDKTFRGQARLSALRKADKILALTTPSQGDAGAREPLKLELSEEWCSKMADREAAQDAGVLEQVRDALSALRNAAEASGKMNGREYVSLGIQVNDAIERANAALARPAPTDALKTVTICIPSGYKDAAEFLKDCQFEEASSSTPSDAGALREALEKITGQAHSGALLGGSNAYQACLEIEAIVARFLAVPRGDEMRLHPLSDIRDLDDVVHELGIQDSSTTPAEAVRALKDEIERLRAAALASPAPATGETEYNPDFVREVLDAAAKPPEATFDNATDMLAHLNSPPAPAPATGETE